MKKSFITLVSVSTLAANFVAADQVFTEDLIVDENLICVGPSCVDGDPDIPGRTGLKIKATNPAILFEDTSLVNLSNPSGDWQLNANGFVESFSISDVTAGTEPFFIEGDAPNSALYIADTGAVGVGTAMPGQNLHILDFFLPAIRIEETGTTPYTWDMFAYSDGFFLVDDIANTAPLRIFAGAPSSSIDIKSDGKTGLGTSTPEGKLHVKGDGVQLSYFESGDGGAVQVRFRTDSENRRFLAVNNANEVKSQIIFLDDRINFTGQTDSGANLWLSIGPDGIISQGPTCGSPCDLTFDPEHFTVPPIAKRAEYMWENLHLPAIGPTDPDTPINLTEKTGGIIHELEVAHIYIEQLHREIAELKSEKARQQKINAQFLIRLEALETN